MLKNKTLVIVESKTKALTIQKYLGKDYIIEATLGHIFDLPKSRLAIDVENDFEVEYKVVRGRGERLAKLRKLARASQIVLLAVDPDREGESIAWHLWKSLEKENKKIYRICFHELSKDSILSALQNLSQIDIALVEAQKTRRILDRLIGYKVSPLLWKQVQRGLSAGRVQSFALHYICQRDLEIRNFNSVEYWNVFAYFKKGKEILEAKLQLTKKIIIEREAKEIIEKIKEKSFLMKKKEENTQSKKPTAPYTTSKLQQEASIYLGFSAQKTMQIAQQLYEGIAVGKEGRQGLITYMRTDSTKISPKALFSLRSYISKKWGDKYLSPKVRSFPSPKISQEAHEAIRPTLHHREPPQIKNYLNADQHRLYKLIWSKFVASQMSNMLIKNKTLFFEVDSYTFLSKEKHLLFDGFSHLFPYAYKEKKSSKLFDEWKEGDSVMPYKIESQKENTKAPPHYTEASLIKFLEESGVGRPSTYAPTLATLLKRKYIQRRKQSLLSLPLGKSVDVFLNKEFPKFLNPKFTANLETKLDQIADKKYSKLKFLENFYKSFQKDIQRAKLNIVPKEKKAEVLSKILCPKCGKFLLEKQGRFGTFWFCLVCQHSQGKTFGECPECKKGKIIKRRNVKRKIYFYACNLYPDCTFTKTKL